MKQKYILSRLPNIAFLCGGKKQESMRSKFIEYVKSEYKHVFISSEATKNIFSNERIIIAEEAERLWQRCLIEENAGYDNLLEFETDIAELAAVIPVFLESPGSILEAGYFFSKKILREKLLIIIEKKRFNNDSFIDKAILQNLSKHERVIYYDNQSHNLREIFKTIFDFRQNLIGHQIQTSEGNPNNLIFFLLKVLCEWKTKKEIIRELDKKNELRKYTEEIDNHLKILKALGFIIEEPNFTERKFLSLLRGDCTLSVWSLASRNLFHEKDIFNQVANQTKSDLVLLKYMKIFSDENHFSYSYKRLYKLQKYKVPNEQLDTLQKILKTRILGNHHIFPVHKSAMAFMKTRGIRQNAEQHIKNQFILRLDFKKFFYSIKRSDFIEYLKDRDHIFNDYHKFICDIAFRDDALTEVDSPLPIGSSSSPAISNMLLYYFDERISEYCYSMSITYTRYADDLTFSHNESGRLCDVKNKVLKILRELPYPSELQINDRKTLHMSKKGRRTITGLFITPSGTISIGRTKKNYIKKLLRDYKKGKNREKALHIQGYLSFIKSVEKNFWNRLYDKYVRNEEDFSESLKFHTLFCEMKKY